MKKTSIPTHSAPTSASEISEAFIHYLWKTKNFTHTQFTSTAGLPIRILRWGQHNYSAGPDFIDGQIEYNGIQWTGHIEMHVKSSDWYLHHHHVDPAYDQVILHVVWEDDRPVKDIHLTPIPTIVLSTYVAPELIARANQLIFSRHRLPCADRIHTISTFWLNSWKERQLIERLEFRTNLIKQRLEDLSGDWEQVAFEMLFRSMGFHANGKALESLAKTIGWKLMRKIIHDPLAIESLLLGRAGFLDEKSSDVFIQACFQEYTFLHRKFEFRRAYGIKWNFKGVRPANFPTIRIAQLAAFLYQKYSLLRVLLETKTLEQFQAFFNIQPSTYWQTHYIPNKKVDKTKINISIPSINSIIINFCVPLLFSYGYLEHKKVYKERAIQLLYRIPQEKNSIISTYTNAGVTCRSAAETQALLHTFKEYCASKQCFNCQVGAKLMSCF